MNIAELSKLVDQAALLLQSKLNIALPGFRVCITRSYSPQQMGSFDYLIYLTPPASLLENDHAPHVTNVLEIKPGTDFEGTLTIFGHEDITKMHWTNQPMSTHVANSPDPKRLAQFMYDYLCCGIVRPEQN